MPSRGGIAYLTYASAHQVENISKNLLYKLTISFHIKTLHCIHLNIPMPCFTHIICHFPLPFDKRMHSFIGNAAAFVSNILAYFHVIYKLIPLHISKNMLMILYPISPKTSVVTSQKSNTFSMSVSFPIT